jgi:alpha-tubulin suppressor-like RCC1 family protein
MCWGNDAAGQLGDGATVSSGGTPRTASGLSNATAIAVGGAHVCALGSTGTVSCWGASISGQAGGSIGATITSPSPVAGVSGASAIATGDGMSCAITGSSVVCWGSDLQGSLGDGPTTNTGPTPRTVALPAGTPRALAAGAYHACAILEVAGARRLYCWGANTSGQIVYPGGSGSIHHAPTEVVLSAEPLGVAAGATHTCALLSTGAVVCWGRDDYGQVRGGAGAAATVAQTVVTGLDAVTQLSAGRFHNCALRTDGRVTCWGRNEAGQCGGGSTSASSGALVDVLPLP